MMIPMMELISSPAQDPNDDWVVEEMKSADFGDKRLHKRLLLILRRLFDAPATGLKAAFKGWAELMAAYRFFDNDKVDEGALLESHVAATLERVRAQSRALVLQDTTELDYSTKKALQGTGALSVEVRQGFFAHSQYVVTPQRLPLGLWGTKIYAREKTMEADKGVEKRDVPIEEKESFRWLEGYRDACHLAELAPQTQVISVNDREGDIYEVFVEWQRRREQGERVAEWLIRSCHDRCLMPFEERQVNAEGVEWPAKLRAAVEQSPLLGTVKFYVARHEGTKKAKGGKGVIKKIRKARHVEQEIRALEADQVRYEQELDAYRSRQPPIT